MVKIVILSSKVLVSTILAFFL